MAPPGPRPNGSDVRSRLLIVDDDADVRVATAANGTEALTAVAQAPVDLIILDVLMPMLNGLDTCRALRARGDATPVLVLTARDAVDDRVAGLEAGADDYLVKPFALRELLARVNALLRRTQPVRDLLGYADLTLDYGEAPASNALQVFVTLLRRKLEAGGLPRLLHNVRGVGYVLRAGR